MDHNTPTWPLSQPVTDPIAKEQLDALERNCKEFGIRLEDRFSPLQGIVHVIGPELGLTQPGMTIVCGDSHTSTHGAFGALAFGIGTSEVEHVLATQTVPQRKPKTMEVRVDGELPLGVTAKDIILGIIGRIGIGGAIGHVIEYTGSAIRGLSMEGRMTVCNMSIEGGARAGMIAPDDTTFHVPRRPAACAAWRGVGTRARRLARAAHRSGAPPSTSSSRIDASDARAARHVGHQPGHGRRRSRVACPIPPVSRSRRRSALDRAGPARTWICSRARRFRTSRSTACSSARAPTRASRTCARRRASSRASRSTRACGRWSCPARSRSRSLPSRKAWIRVFTDAGFEWREAGCSMCLGMNPDILQPGERCASTSNRNFEGRQGKGGRTHLVSPPMAAAAAIAGHFVDIRDWND